MINHKLQCNYSNIILNYSGSINPSPTNIMEKLKKYNPMFVQDFYFSTGFSCDSDLDTCLFQVINNTQSRGYCDKDILFVWKAIYEALEIPMELLTNELRKQNLDNNLIIEVFG
jgi:hypothetical protein